jgi:hypothetical protein
MKSLIHIFIILMLVFTSNALGKEKTITVKGSVVDSVTNEPLSGVIVMLTDKLDDILNGNIDSVMNNLDTATTDENGDFETEVTVDDGSMMITAVGIKASYKIGISIGIVLGNSATVRKMKLQPEVFKEIVVKGVVKDSITKEPIPDAMVLVSNTSVVMDSIFDTVATDASGIFEVSMQIGTGTGMLAPRVIYVVQKDGYQVSMGIDSVGGDVEEFDIGDILLQEEENSINYLSSKKTFVLNQANQIYVYSLNGRLLYKGKPIKLTQLKLVNQTGYQPVVIQYRMNQKIIREAVYTPLQ